MSETVLMNPPDAPAAPVAALAAPVAAPSGPLADLILVRLLPAKDSIPPKRLRDDLSPLFRQPPSIESIAETIAALRAAELVQAKGQLLTDAGRAHAMAYLGVTELPPKADWRTVKANYLAPKALHLSPTSNSDAKTCGDAKKLAAMLLKRELGLPVGAGNTLNAVFEAIACRELGYPDYTKLGELVPHMLGKAMGSSEPISKKDAEKVLPRVLLNTPKAGMEGLRAVALLALTSDASPQPEAERGTGANHEMFDLETFANTVKAVARRSPTGWFGGNKVFISHVWRQLKDEPRFAPLGLTGFKEKLIEANRENRLTLSRADLVQEMDPSDVQQSETAYLNALFHFILVEKP